MKRITLAVLLCVLAALPLSAAGTVTVTLSPDLGLKLNGQIAPYVVAWTSDGSGVVTGNPITLGGAIRQIKFVPGSSSAQPTDLYDVSIVDEDGLAVTTVDGVLLGGDLSSTTPKQVVFPQPIVVDARKTLDVRVSNAGAAKSGTIYIWIER